MIDGDAVTYAPLPFYQQVLVVLIVPPITTSVLCLWIKVTGKMLGTSNTRAVRNTTDRVAFLTFLSLSYAVLISIMIYAHYSHH
jgi:hypothetical protein